MLKSMTAFARFEKITDNVTVAAQIRSYNSRHLDIALRIPSAYLPLEENIKSLLSSKIARGRVEVAIQIKDDSDDAYTFELDRQKAVAYHQALSQLNDILDLQSKIPLELIVSAGIIRPDEIDIDLDGRWIIIRESLNEAVDGLDAMRLREGGAIARDFDARLDYIEKCIDTVEQESTGLIDHYQERLKERIAVLTKGLIEIDPGRIVQEAAFLADRSDISEEIVRARSHIKQFRIIMASEEPAGRKLNFLLQEFNREFNTMGSKTGNQNVSYIIVDVKSEIEKIREQVQNVE